MMRWRLSIGETLLLIALVSILVLTLLWAWFVWNTGENLMDKHGWIALGLGTLFSLLIGCGLMALMFFSSRTGHDEAADPFRDRDKPHR
jgi:formate hydrogenlyase subunit 3/multisubunit Na+/H+ antiporter MnhD subunit